MLDYTSADDGLISFFLPSTGYFLIALFCDLNLYYCALNFLIILYSSQSKQFIKGKFYIMTTEVTINYEKGSLAIPTGLFINGQFVPSQSGKKLTLNNPSTGHVSNSISKISV